jgi:hypothetical protein
MTITLQSCKSLEEKLEKSCHTFLIMDVATHGHPLVRTIVILDEGPIRLQYDLMVTNYLCKNPVFKSD